MLRVDWKDEYNTGIEALDHEHRLLVETVNAACDSLGRLASPDEVADCLGLLYERVCAHFALEEQLMRQSKYALYAVHKEGHEKLLERMREMMDAFQDGVCTGCNRKLDECLVSWFEQHFQLEDGRLATLKR